LNNQTSGLEKKEIINQLGKAEVQKKKLIKSIYTEYELYLELIRNLLNMSVDKGVQGFFLNTLIKDFVPSRVQLHNFFEKKISHLINSQLPLITIEQLQINKFDENIIQEKCLNDLKISAGSEYSQKDSFTFEDDFISRKSLRVNIKNQNSSPDYYESPNIEKFLSIDLDHGDKTSFYSDVRNFEKKSLEERFTISLIELLEGENVDKLGAFEKSHYHEKDKRNGNNTINNFELLENSLNNLLRNLSYKVNLELFKSKFINKIITENNFNYLSKKKLMIKQPYPFIIKFEMNNNQSFKNNLNFFSICLLNITTVELEFKNLNLSLQKNKINELKNQFQLLLKKERYWKQKEINLNKIFE